MVPIVLRTSCPVGHLRRACRRQDWAGWTWIIVCMGCLNRRQVLPRLSQCLLGLSQTSEENQGILVSSWLR